MIYNLEKIKGTENKNGGYFRNMRIFIAIRLNNDTKSHLKNITENLSAFFERAHFSRIENYHITIRFIGEADRAEYEKIVSAVKKIAPAFDEFSLTIGGPGSFKRKNKHIFYCGLENSDKLKKLHDFLNIELDKAGIVSGSVKFSPHITLAREVVLSDGYHGIEYEARNISVGEISVMESTRINGKLTYIPRFTAELGGRND